MSERQEEGTHKRAGRRSKVFIGSVFPLLLTPAHKQVAINGGNDTGARPASQTLRGTLAYLARRTMVLSIKNGANPHCVLLFCFHRKLDGVKRWHLPLFLRRARSADIEAQNPSVAPGLENPMLNFGPQRHV